ncbi:polymorphic toxin-type HINT domain-containing protein [Streptosporangium sp. CA-115845]|uniref:polymorphic toxin-type HINT domain-containing protein n=1 Tax=Streptosporangium sp. CA-115845 TaxID=3240071 RepID=UPI003D914AAA
MVYDADGERLIRREPDGTATLYLGAMELELSGGTVKATRYYTGPDGSTIALRTTSGIQCFTTGNLGACGETALNILGSLAGGLAGKLATKYALPWKWKKAYELGKKLWKHAGDAINAFKSWVTAKDKLKIAEKARETAQKAYAACGKPSSFVPGTKVAMADGTEKPIEQVKVGDKVIATDPETGTTRAKPIIALITSKGVKNLVQITVDTDGDKGSATGVVIATDEHPFWVSDQRAWVQATKLQSGAWLWTSSGDQLQTVGIAKWTTGHQRVHNLTVAETHTYYVLAGATPVLVHNAGSDDDCIPGYENPGHHDPQGGPNPYNPNKGVLPTDAAEQFQNSTLIDGVRWTKIGSGKRAVYYRYSNDGHGNWHWSGSSNGVDNRGNPVEIPLNHIPIQIRRR